MNSNVVQQIILPLRICTKCGSIYVTLTKSSNWNECLIVHCTACENQWYICTTHSKKFSSSDYKRMNKHFSVCHECVDNKIQETTADNNYTSNIDFSEYEEYNNNKCKKRDIEETEKCSTDSNEQILKRLKSENQSTNDNFFNNDMENDKAGIHGLVLSSFQRSNNISSTISHDEAMFHIELTRSLITLPENSQESLISLLHKSTTIDFCKTRLPRSMNDVKWFYTSNKTSIYQNIPSPRININSNHAYVSIQSVIHHALALGIDIPLIKSSQYLSTKFDNSHLLTTTKAKEIMKDSFEKNYPMIDPYIIFLVIWSDDFEVNHTRKNRSSTWLKTISIVPPKNLENINLYTYAICLGSKKDDHFYVNKIFNEELIQLQTPKEFYVCKLKKYLPIVIRVMAMSADRPERSTLNNMSSHSSHSAKRWMYSSLTDPHNMASCTQCYLKRIQKLFLGFDTNDISHCRKCCDFDFASTLPLNRFRCPNNYPRYASQIKDNINVKPPKGRDEFSVNGSQDMLPLKLDYSLLGNGLKYALYQYSVGSWKKKETLSYLKLMCIKESTVLQYINKIDIIKQQGKDFTNMINDMDMPPMWNGLLSLDQFIETPMHLLFEGLVKSSIEILILYMKFHKKWTKFSKLCNELLEDIETLHLSYCMTDGLTNVDDMKTGGWLAETYLAFSRIMIVIIGHIDEYIHHDELGLNELQLMFESLFALISRLMSDTNINTDEIGEYIKLFLGICHFYEDEIGFEINSKGDKTNPFWYNKSNYVSLLNLPDQIKTYGPVRLHWEGVKEKFIQNVKPTLKNKRTSVSYLVTKLEKIFKTNNFNLILNRYDNKPSSKSYHKYKDLKLYKSALEIESSILNWESISALIMKDQPGKIFVAVKTQDKLKLHKMIMDKTNSFMKANMWYQTLKLKMKPTYIFREYVDLLEEVNEYLLLIPFFTKQTDDDNGYTAVSKNWKVVDNTGNLIFYNPPLNKLQHLYQKKNR